MRGVSDQAGPEDAAFTQRLVDREAWYGPGGKPWARWSRAAIALGLVGLLAIAAANVAVNPRAEFPHRWYPPLVGDDPLEKLRAYRALDEPPSRIVLGSSRAAMLLPANATASGFNFAIPGGGLQDDRIAYDFVRSRQGAPDAVVLGLDAFQFSAQDYRDVAVHRSRAAPAMTGEGVAWSEWLETTAATLSPGYGLDTVRSLAFAHGGGYPEPARTTGPDGVMAWGQVDRRRAEGSYDLAAVMEENWATFKDRYAADKVPAAAVSAEADQFIERMLGDGVSVAVVLLPYHPALRDRLEATTFPALQEEALKVAVGLCGAGELEVFDFTDPAVPGVPPTEFYDGIHLAPEGARRVAAALGDPSLDLCRASGMASP